MTPILTEKDIEAVSRLVRERSGIVLGMQKRSMMEARLLRLMRRHGLADMAALRDMMDSPGGEPFRLSMVEAMTTNVTAFFREPAHFDALAKAIPQWREKVRAGGRVRLWSAGCASGEEAYSMAATVLLHWPDAQTVDLRILATDLSPAMIQRARDGLYPARDFVTPALVAIAQPGPAAELVSIAPSARRLIHFAELNLFKDWPFRGMFDAIFCRNVVIYFDEPSRIQLWLRFAARMETGAMLCLGHAERIDEAQLPQFERCGVTRYRRTEVPVPDGIFVQPLKVNACP